MSDDGLDAYLTYTARYLNATGLLGLYVGCELSGRKGLGFFYHDVPTPSVAPGYSLDTVNPPDTSPILGDLLTRRPGEIVLDLPVHDAVFGGTVLPDNAAYHDETVFFARNISYCCMVVMGPGAILAPGNYTTTYRLKVPENQSHVPFAKLYVVDSANTTHWRVLTEQFLAPSDFHADQYQNFTLSFTLSEFATNVEFLVDYYRGPTDLYADYIVTTREERDGLPNFASVVVGFGFPDRSELYTVQLAETIRAQGGVVVHPDEFSAALNRRSCSTGRPRSSRPTTRGYSTLETS